MLPNVNRQPLPDWLGTLITKFFGFTLVAAFGKDPRIMYEAGDVLSDEHIGDDWRALRPNVASVAPAASTMRR